MDVLPTDPLLCPECGDPIAEHFEHGCFVEKAGGRLCKCTAPSKLLHQFAEQVNRINQLEGQYAIVLHALREYAKDENWGSTSPLIWAKQYNGLSGIHGAQDARKALDAVEGSSTAYIE